MEGTPYPTHIPSASCLGSKAAFFMVMAGYSTYPQGNPRKPESQRPQSQCSVMIVGFTSVQLLSCVRLFVTPWTAACQASLSITNSRSLPKLTSIELVMPSNHLISIVAFSSCLQSFPASGSFPMSHFFTSGDQSMAASTSDLPRNIQD